MLSVMAMEKKAMAAVIIRRGSAKRRIAAHQAGTLPGGIMTGWMGTTLPPPVAKA